MAQPADRAFEIFVKRTLATIQKESWGRSKECKELRDLCQNVLNLLHAHESGHLMYDGSLAVAVLEPLYLATASPNAKIVDAALGCLHKLVAHAWLQGESSSGGQPSDADVVSRVIRAVIAVGEGRSGGGGGGPEGQQQQLAVIRALLTFTTAEHFVAHGDCLLAAVRMVFNLALGAEEEIIRRTASNALLQMLNTITKRVTAPQLHAGSSAATSRRSSLDGVQPVVGVGGSHGGGVAAGQAHHGYSRQASGARSPAPGMRSPGLTAAGMGPSPPPSGGGAAELQRAVEGALAEAAGWDAAAAPAGAAVGPGGAASRDAGGSLDSRALSRALSEALSGTLPDAAAPTATLPSAALRSGSSSSFRQLHSSLSSASALTAEAAGLPAWREPGSGGGTAAGDDVGAGAGGASRTAQLATLAEQRDLAGLEAALGGAAAVDEGLAPEDEQEEGPLVGRVRHPVHSAGGLGAAGVSGMTPGGGLPSGVSLGGGGGHAGGGAGPHGHPPGAPSYSLRTSSPGPSLSGQLPSGYVPPSPPPPAPPPPPHRAAMPIDGGRAGAAHEHHAGHHHQHHHSAPAGGYEEAPLRPVATAGAGSASGEAGGSPFLTPGTPEASGAARPSHAQPTHTASRHSLHRHSHGHQHGLSPGPGGRAPAARPLRTFERDVLLVLTAFCRLASRESGVTEIDKYLAAGKLLALELVVKVLQNPSHCWDNVRDELVRHLHQPLCLALLRNCSPAEPAAFGLAVKLLTALLLQPKLRRGLKAELGAFYPLLLLRPLEAESLGPGELRPVASCLPCLGSVASDPQLLVDLFVNYDCDLKAPNLYERTVQALSRLAARSELDEPAPASAPKAAELARQLGALREGALKCLLAAVACLDAWAGPLKEGAAGGEGGNGTGNGGEGGERAVEAPGMNGAGFGVGLGLGGAGLGGGGGGIGGESRSEAERFEAAKVAKSSLGRGLALFNGGSPVKAMRALIGSGVVEDSPAGAAVFLRAHAAELEPACLGEYLGHHEEFELAVMRAYVDMERFGGMPIDVALRAFLSPFRPPGEAQKIDRLMEAFAERYTADNPAAFRTADAAYVLSFAIIMLNTDAHNPLAERRLDRAGFVAMTSLPVSSEEGGGGVRYEPALPVPELERIYDRIVAQEIVVRNMPTGGAGNGGAAGAGGRAGAGAGAGGRGWRSGGNKLAAALGLRALVAPFRSGGAADRKQVSDAERQRQQMMEVAEAAVARGVTGGGSGGGAAGSIGASPLSSCWHTCTHAAHTRPMLTVSGEALLTALVAAAGRAPDAAAAEPTLTALLTLAALAGLMGLEELCEGAVAAVAAAAGLTAPAAHGTTAAGKQLAALRMLLAAAGGADAGQLGSAWAIVLRSASELEALVRVVTRPLQPGEVGVIFVPPPVPTPATPAAPAVVAASPSGAGLRGGPSVASAGGAADASGRSGGSTGGGLFSKMFGGLWSGGGAASSGGAAGGGGRGSPAGRKDTAGGGGGGPASLPPPPVRAVPGAASVMWAVTEGRTVIEQVYRRSGSLDGEAVVVFVRALCAVSREELDAAQPRVYSLQRLVEVAHLNLSGRIRLIWSKLWAVLSSHLVMAACHPAQPIAAQAVDALRSLATRLLERTTAAAATALGQQHLSSAAAAGGGTPATTPPQAAPAAPLTHSAWGAAESALRPFVSVLRLSDDAGVRAMALSAVSGFISGPATARGLGAGWRIAVEALRRAAEDPSAAVYEQALGALEVAVAALFRTAAAAAPPSPSPAASPLGKGTPGSAAAAVAAAAPGHDCYRETLRAVLAAVRNPHQLERAPAAVRLLVSCGGRLAQRPPAASTQHHHHTHRSREHANQHHWPHPASSRPSLEATAGGAPSSTPLSPQPTQPAQLTHGSLVDQLLAAPAGAAAPLDDWALLLEVVGEVAATPGDDGRPIATAGLEAALELMRLYSTVWGRRAWRVMLRRVVAGVALRVPPALDPAANPAEAAAAAAAGLPLESIAAGFVARVERLFPLLCAQLATLAAAAAAAGGDDAHGTGRRRRGSYNSDDSDSDGEAGYVYGNRGPGVGAHAAAAAPPALHLELMGLMGETCLGWFRHPSEPVSRAGLSSLARLMDVAAGGTALVADGPKGRLSTAAGPAAAAAQQRGWDVLLPLLSSALRAELDLVTGFVEQLRRRQQEQAAAATAASVSAPSPTGTAAAPSLLAPLPPVGDMRVLRCRCRMLLLLQRSLAEFAAARAGSLPWRVLRQLIELLDGTARRLMAFNMREELPPEAQQQEQGRNGSGNDGEGTSAGAAEEREGEASTSGRGAAADGWGDDDGWNDGWEDGEDGEGSRGSGRGGSKADLGGTRRTADGAGSAAEEQQGGAPAKPPSQRPLVLSSAFASASGSAAAAAGEGAAPSPAMDAGPSSSSASATASASAPTAATAPSAGAASRGAASAGACLALPAPQLQLTSATSHDSLRPVLARLEAEATDAATTLLLLACSTSPSPSSSSSSSSSSYGAHAQTAAEAEEQRREARQRLLALCRHILACNVAAHTAAAAPEPRRAPHHAASAATPLEPAPLDPALPGSSWDHAVRAGVLARAVRVLLLHSSLPGDERGGAEQAGGTRGAASASFSSWAPPCPHPAPGVGAAPLLGLLPQVAALLVSHQPLVRCAVAEFLEAVVGPRVAELAAAEEGRRA